MPFTKTWTGATNDLTLATNWQAISVRTSAWSWTASGSGTNEYYLRTAASGNPGFAATPASVYINGASATSGTPGSLAAGRWGYGDNDSLGYSTIYVRLSDGTDPDSKAADYVTFYQVPKAAEHVIIPISGGVTIAQNLDLSAVAIGDFRVDAKWAGTIGSATNFLRIDPDSFQWAGGTGYIDLGAAAIPVRVADTARPAAGYYALNLRGSAISTADIAGGYVGIASQRGDTAAVTTLRQGGGQVLVGSGATVTTVELMAGTLYLNASATTVTCTGGRLVLGEAAAITTLSLYGAAQCDYGSTGNITTVNQYDDSTFDEDACEVARTITTYNHYSGTLRDNPSAVTHTNHPRLNRATSTRRR